MYYCWDHLFFPMNLPSATMIATNRLNKGSCSWVWPELIQVIAYTTCYFACGPVNSWLPGCFFQIHWVHWAAPCCGSPGAPVDSAWASIWETVVSLPAGRSSAKKRANHHMGSLLGLPALPPPLLHLLHLNPQKGRKTRTGSPGPRRGAARTQGRGRWRRALLEVMTSSAGGGGEKGVRGWITDRPEITCREAKTVMIDGHMNHRNKSEEVTSDPQCIRHTFLLNALSTIPAWDFQVKSCLQCQLAFDIQLTVQSEEALSYTATADKKKKLGYFTCISGTTNTFLYIFSISSNRPFIGTCSMFGM